MQGPRRDRLTLVSRSAITVLKHFMIFEQKPSILSLHWALFVMGPLWLPALGLLRERRGTAPEMAGTLQQGDGREGRRTLGSLHTRTEDPGWAPLRRLGPCDPPHLHTPPDSLISPQSPQLPCSRPGDFDHLDGLTPATPLP